MYADFGVNEDCINIYSYGEICVRCGCCKNEPNEIKRIENQIKYYKERLIDEKNFSMFDEDEFIRKIQENNVKKNIEYYKKKLSELVQLKEQMQKGNE